MQMPHALYSKSEDKNQKKKKKHLKNPKQQEKPQNKIPELEPIVMKKMTARKDFSLLELEVDI